MTHKGTVILETERLTLRRYIKSDLEPMFNNCWGDHDVWKWTGYEPMNCIEDVLKLNNIFTDFWFAKYDRLNYYNWAIQLKSSKEVIGRFRGMNPDDKLCQIDIGYEIGKRWWNSGLATEASGIVIDFFFTEVGFNRIQANHANENPASGKVMQKCGMTYEGTERQAFRCNNGLFDKVNYAMLADDYYNICSG